MVGCRQRGQTGRLLAGGDLSKKSESDSACSDLGGPPTECQNSRTSKCAPPQFGDALGEIERQRLSLRATYWPAMGLDRDI